MRILLCMALVLALSGCTAWEREREARVALDEVIRMESRVTSLSDRSKVVLNYQLVEARYPGTRSAKRARERMERFVGAPVGSTKK